MGWDILHDQERGLAAFFCDTADEAFGPVVVSPDPERMNAKEALERFVEDSSVDDPRVLRDNDRLETRFNDWYEDEQGGS